MHVAGLEPIGTHDAREFQSSMSSSVLWIV
jgi:hypothetical protein